MLKTTQQLKLKQDMSLTKKLVSEGTLAPRIAETDMHSCVPEI